MKSKPFLSKSTFIRGMQCEKSLYLHKKRPFLRDRLSPEQLAKFRRGHDVGFLAQQLFPGGIDLTPAGPARVALAAQKTAGLIGGDEKLIYEAAFEFNGVRIFIDILHHDGNAWHAVEVKSSRRLSETYMQDAALQLYVMKGAGLAVETISLAYINDSYIRDGAIDIHKLFTIEDVTLRAKALEGQTIERIEAFRKVDQLTSSPEIPVGAQCFFPYPCDFFGHCWKKILPAYYEGFSDYVHREKSSWFTWLMSGAATPVVLSLLCVRPAIPVFDGTRPYQLMPVSVMMGRPDSAQNFVWLTNPAMPYDPGSSTKKLRQEINAQESLVVFDAGELTVLCDITAHNSHGPGILDIHEKLNSFSPLNMASIPVSDLSQALSMLGQKKKKHSAAFKNLAEFRQAWLTRLDNSANGEPPEVFMEQSREFHEVHHENLLQLTRYLMKESH